MNNFFLALPSGLMLVGYGFWFLLMPLDDLWKKEEERLLKQGIQPKQRQRWEKTVRRGGWLMIALGIAMPMVVGLWLTFR